jgi:hypothetical protein
MNKFVFILLFFLNLSTRSFSNEFHCQTNRLTSFSQVWAESESFLTLNYQGPLAAQAFPNIGEAGSQYFSVIMLRDWCQYLEDTILCETPQSALVNIESSVSPDGPKTTSSFRFFSTVLNYRADGWAFLKIRAKRLDELPPITFNTQLPVGSCQIDTQ